MSNIVVTCLKPVGGGQLVGAVCVRAAEPEATAARLRTRARDFQHRGEPGR
jgi:hypothetical protein